jgi:hypothetical protein
MSGVVNISPEVTWVAAGIFDRALEVIANEIESSAPELAKRLLRNNARTATLEKYGINKLTTPDPLYQPDARPPRAR